MLKAWEFFKSNPAECLLLVGLFASVWSGIFGGLSKGFEKFAPRVSMVLAGLAGIGWVQIFRGTTGKGLENDPSVRAAIESPIAPVEATQAPPKAEPPALPESTKVPPLPPMGPLVLMCLALVGCGGATDTIARYAETARDVEVFAEGCAVEQKKVDLAACTDEPCKASVHEKWEPIADLFDASNKLWCAVSPDSEGCKK